MPATVARLAWLRLDEDGRQSEGDGRLARAVCRRPRRFGVGLRRCRWSRQGVVVPPEHRLGELRSIGLGEPRAVIVEQRRHCLERAQAHNGRRRFTLSALRGVQRPRGEADAALERGDLRFRGVGGRGIRMPDVQPVPERFNVSVDDRRVKLVRFGAWVALRPNCRRRATTDD